MCNKHKKNLKTKTEQRHTAYSVPATEAIALFPLLLMGLDPHSHNPCAGGCQSKSTSRSIMGCHWQTESPCLTGIALLRTPGAGRTGSAQDTSCFDCANNTFTTILLGCSNGVCGVSLAAESLNGSGGPSRVGQDHATFLLEMFLWNLPYAWPPLHEDKSRR